MKTTDPPPPPKPDARQVREVRLARALRDNLRRRKGSKTESAPSQDPD
jgi:hypothetical protein